MPEENKNVFEQMAEEGQVPEKVEENENLFGTGEIDFNKLSNVPVGQNKKYDRPDLNGKEVKILRAQVFPAGEEEEPITALNNAAVKYFKCMFLVTYDTKNKEGMFDREYLSGAIQFVQKDGSRSMPSFWNEGASNQVSELWEKVAAFKKVEPKDLSPREFMAFLNSGIKVKLERKEVEFKKEKFYKNMIAQIIG